MTLFTTAADGTKLPAIVLTGGHDSSIYITCFGPVRPGLPLLLASSDYSFPCAIRLWDADAGVPVGNPLIGHDSMVMSMAFSPVWPGKPLLLASCSGETIRLWDVDSRVLAGQVHCDASGLSCRRVRLDGVSGLPANAHRLLLLGNRTLTTPAPVSAGCIVAVL